MAQDDQSFNREGRYCSSCGEPLVPGSNFCGRCGAPIQPIQPQLEQDGIYFPVRLIIGYEFADPLSEGQLVNNRLLVLVKWLFAIPLYLFGALYGIAAFIATFLAFWAVLFSGRFPRGLFDFVAGFVQYEYRILAYFPLLLTNHWSPDEDHPLKVQIDYPEDLSRPVLLLLKLPSFLIGLVSNIVGFSFLVMFLLSINAWLLILLTGRYPVSLFPLTCRILEWSCRVTVWQNLMRDDASLFGTTTRVKLLVGFALLFSLFAGFENCSITF